MDIQDLLGSPNLRANVDQSRNPEELPWIPQAEGVCFKPVRLSLSTGTWTNLLRVTKKGAINLHRQLGVVEAWVLQGSWRYLVEHDWVARPGTYVFEPAGDVHTLATSP
jgi:2,4'-dihydroxyacetophenone dioxygenase